MAVGTVIANNAPSNRHSYGVVLTHSMWPTYMTNANETRADKQTLVRFTQDLKTTVWSVPMTDYKNDRGQSF